MESDRTIYGLKLHQTLEVDLESKEDGSKEEHWKVTRVPGGFIYYSYKNKLQTFVPYNEEFKEEDYRKNIF